MKKVLVVLAIFSTLFVSCIDEISGSAQIAQVEECDAFKLQQLARLNAGEIDFAEYLLILKDSDCALACTPEQQAAFDALDSTLESVIEYLNSIGANIPGTTIEDQLTLVGLGC